MGKRQKQGRSGRGGERIYELEVTLLAGPVTEEFAGANPVVSRTIQIRGDQTLETLHEAIFDAFEREEEHMYEFQLGGERPMDPKGRRYSLPADQGLFGEQKPDGVVTTTTIDSLGLKKDDVFCYWFDFGDDWWHQIDVVAVHDGPGSGEYPRVTASIGESPPQYSDWDEEDFDEDEEDEEG